MLRWILLIFVFLSMACGALAATPTVATTPQATPTDEAVKWHEYELGGINLGLNTPDGWQTYYTESLVILAEESAPIPDSDKLTGIIVHIFIHPLDSFVLPSGDDANVALAVLRQIVVKPDYIGPAKVSKPVAFDWGGYDAAFYLVQHDSNSALLVALALPESGKLLVWSFSAPTSQAQRIRAMLPRILNHFTLNGEFMSAEALEALPNPLHFPDSSSVNQQPDTE